MEAALATIYVRNGDWDEACAALRANLERREARFNAKIDATFARKEKAAEPQKSKAAPRNAKSFSLGSGSSSLSRSRLRG